MSVAIVSAGPSAAATWPARRQRYDVVVAVNGAAECKWLGPYDWWSAADKTTIRSRPPFALPRIGVLTTEATSRTIANGGSDFLPRSMRCMLWQDLDRPFKDFTWSIVAASAQVCQLYQPTSVDFYGCDWSGDQDCTGRTTRLHSKKRPPGRKTNRWNSEPLLLSQVSRHYRIPFYRITKEYPDGQRIDEQ